VNTVHKKKGKKLQRLNKTAIQTAKILKAFTLERGEWGITALADYLGFAKSTVHGIVQALVQENILKRSNRDSLYKCGSQMMRLGLLTLTELEIKRISRDVLLSLNDITGETVFLTIYMEGRIRVVGSRESDKPLRLSISVGSEMPIDRGACAKVLFSYLPETEREKIKRDENFDATIVESSMTDVLRDGYATSKDEVYTDISAVAAPIFNGERQLEGMIVIGGVLAYINQEKLREYGRILKSKCDDLTLQLEHVL